MRNGRRFSLPVWSVSALCVFGSLIQGCRSQTLTRAAGYTEHGLQEAAPDSDLAIFGVPESKPDYPRGPVHYVVRKGYVLEHGDVDKIPLWVCEHVLKSHTKGSAKRKNNFKPDPLLPKGARSELKDYSGSGYDRGHQAPAGDFKHSQTRMNESFYLSNMAPQVGVGFNRQIWKNLEEDVRSAAEDLGDVYVITGGFFYDPEEDDPSTADGMIEYEVIGPGAVAVPTHFYKIVIHGSPDDMETVEAIGFVLENRKYSRSRVTKDDVKSIRWIEEHTGFDFMPELSASRANAIEARAAMLWEEFE